MSISNSFLTQFSWDQRCRNSDVRTRLNALMEHGDSILDAGCGENILLQSIKKGFRLGIDIEFPTAVDNTFLKASILQLPFADSSFSFVSSVDVLEHLPIFLRYNAVSEMVRVSRKGIVVAFPFGGIPEEVDTIYRDDLVSRGADVPDWLKEHLSQRYPTMYDVRRIILEMAAEKDCDVDVSIVFSESITMVKVLRWLSVRSKFAYLTANVGAGILYPVFPKPKFEPAAYRAVLIAQLVPREKKPTIGSNRE